MTGTAAVVIEAAAMAGAVEDVVQHPGVAASAASHAALCLHVGAEVSDPLLDMSRAKAGTLPL
jgi:hypothetical protein